MRQIDDHHACGAQPTASGSVDNVGANAIRYFQQFQVDTGAARNRCAPQPRSGDTTAAIRGRDYISTLFQHAYCASPAADAAGSSVFVLC